MPLTGDDKPSGAFFAPIDLVEDRMRNRVVGVAALFCMYLFVGAQFIDTKTGSAYELTSSVTFASALPAATRRTASFMTHPVFSSHQSEHQMLRYIFKLAQRDISLVHCMIPLGSCTMKLNATAEMMPITWPELNRIHPFAPAEQTQGYAELI